MLRPLAAFCGIGVALAACTVDPLASTGRPCSPGNPCGPDAVCDSVSGVCVAASLDRGPVKDLAAREQAPGGERRPPDLSTLDRPRPSEAGCATGLTLCGAVCVDLATDHENCGACNKQCGAPQSDRCVDKLCVCGLTGGPCTQGTVCASGICDPNPCLGKSDGTACDDKLYCTVNDACKGGFCLGTARDCTGGISACMEASCDEAIDQCVTKNKLDGVLCPGGQCYAGSCCTGCWTGNACMAGKDGPACGSDGDLCQNCTTTECRSLGGPCDGIIFEKCGTIWAKPDGTACNGGACRKGGCCKGCWDGDGCRIGTIATACGAVGGLCKDCTSECRTGSTCSGGSCADPAKPDGAACTGGKCLGGLCCKGCVANGTCQSGTSPSNCGVGAASCTTCPVPGVECKKATCVGGACGVGNASDGAACTSGTCLGGICCKGCVSGSTCYPGTAATACGKGGVNCASCPAATPTCNTAGTCT